MSTRSEIVDRVRKMMALSNDAGATQGEVDNAIAGIRKLMTKYGIEEHECAPREQSSPLIDRNWGKKRSQLLSWERRLAQACAMICDCRLMVRTVGRDRFVTFIGLAHDTDLAHSLFNILGVTARTMARARYKKACTSYLLGFATGVVDQAESLQKAAQQEHALILRKDTMVVEWIGKNIHGIKASRGPRPVANGAAFYTGRVDGKHVQLNRRVR